MLTKVRITDDNALRAKVVEALTVYDDYIKTKGADYDDAPKMNGAEDNVE